MRRARCRNRAVAPCSRDLALEAMRPRSVAALIQACPIRRDPCPHPTRRPTSARGHCAPPRLPPSGDGSARETRDFPVETLSVHWNEARETRAAPCHQAPHPARGPPAARAPATRRVLRWRRSWPRAQAVSPRWRQRCAHALHSWLCPPPSTGSLHRVVAQ